MRKSRSLDVGRWPIKSWRLGIIAGLIAALGFALFSPPQAQESPAAALPAAVEPIYAKDPNDSWNRIFYYLFSRRFKARLSDDFPEGAPFAQFGQNSDTPLSSRLFERTETGDRAIEPLYHPFPSTPAGRRQLLVEPLYSGFVEAMQEALKETTARPALARALMQSDLWAAYDILQEPLFSEDRSAKLDHRQQVVLDLLGRMIAKIALTRSEIKALPGNYAAAMVKYSLPDLFSRNSGWIEIQWFPNRTHDAVARYRHYTRIFIKPAHAPQDKQKFLDSMRDPYLNASSTLDGVALAMQSILIDSQGKLTPTRLTTDVQFRLFKKSDQGVFTKTEVRVCELSRKLMLTEPDSGGLTSEDGSSPTYRGGYWFAQPSYPDGPSGELGPPILVKLATRCSRCHGEAATRLITFSFTVPPHSKAPTVRELDPAASEAADSALSNKNKSQVFRSLRAYFR
jgi:hypothetical protein